MKKVILGILIFLLIFSCKTYAFLEGGEPQPLGFLPMEVGARALGMGGAFSAIADDASSAYWNPAGLVQLKEREFSFMSANLTEDRKYNYIGIVEPSTSGVFAISYAPCEVGGNPIYDNEGNFEGYSDYKYTGYLISYGTSQREGLNTGISIGYYKESFLDSRGKAWGINLGMLYELPKVSPPFESAKIGLVFQNVTGSKMKWKNTATNPSEKIPAYFKIGIAGKLFEEKLTIALDYAEKEGTRLGAEYWIKNIIGLRAGTFEGNKTFGASFKMEKYQIDYAYVEEELDNGQRLSFTARF
jgi:hypothetical protein